MVYKKFYGSQEQFWGWNCIYCGEIVDPVILENRDMLRNGMLLEERKSKHERR
jgi:hypothetical protein